MRYDLRINLTDPAAKLIVATKLFLLDHPPQSRTTCIQTFIFIKTKTERRGKKRKWKATFSLLRDGTLRLALIEALKNIPPASASFAPHRFSRSVELHLPSSTLPTLIPEKINTALLRGGESISRTNSSLLLGKRLRFVDIRC
ncbi:hypothetical protein CEXT_452411 [Caerostris extrusa]|uniref:Ribosomal protein S10 n=1 Tax=Caerostris extrusa TaxID=172846 RepID=A0AAV4TI25_CAEEX|nr:hypothetical protein CEXT_452411 [Caerostris extrusa]